MFLFLFSDLESTLKFLSFLAKSIYVPKSILSASSVCCQSETLPKALKPTEAMGSWQLCQWNHHLWHEGNLHTTWLLMWGNWRLRSRWTSLPLHLIPPTPLNKLLQIADMLYCSVTLALCSMVLLLWVAVRCGYVHRPAVFFCQSDGLTFSSVKLHCFTNVYLSHLI